MPFQISLRLELVCTEGKAADDELDLMVDHIESRLSDGADLERVMQALAEALIGLNEAEFGDADIIH